MDYISNTDSEKQQMLKKIGVKAVEDLFKMIPAEIVLEKDLAIKEGISELELIRQAQKLAAQNVDLTKLTSFLGAGAYNHYVPGVITSLTDRAEFYTAYTPYQAELSQGTLEAIYEYQSMISELTGLGISNASMLDGASAAAEAVLMAARVSRRSQIILPSTINPAYREVIKTYGRGKELDFIELKAENHLINPESIIENLNQKTAAIVLQYPNFFGSIEDFKQISNLVKKNEKTLLVVIANPLLLGILKAPADFGADIVVGEAQSLGNGINYGGPYLGFMACRDDRKLLRQLPGRIVGKTTDSNDKAGFVLTLQTREQHIRREKATSNICTNEALNALMATIYLATMGKAGLQEVASQCYQKAHYLADKIEELTDYQVLNKDNFIHEFVLKVKKDPLTLKNRLRDKNILIGYHLQKVTSADEFLVCVTEKITKAELDNFIEELEVF